MRTVLHVSRVGFVGGAERVLLTLAAGLPRHGYQMALVCPEGPLVEAAKDRGVAVWTAPLSRMQITHTARHIAGYGPALFSGARDVLAACRASQASLIHVHHPVGGLYARLAAKLCAVPLILHLHDGLPLKALYSLALRHASRSAARVISVSGAAREAFLAAEPNGDCDVIYNGVDWDFLGDFPRPASDLSREGPCIGVFGTLAARKGQDTFSARCRSRRIPSSNRAVLSRRRERGS